MTKAKIDTVVTLTVDTKNISQSNKNSSVVFTDNRSDPAENPGDPKDYVSTVDLGKNITWSGVPDPNASNPGDSVQVIFVLKKPGSSGGADILKQNYNPGTTISGITTVTANIKDKNQTGIESYYVIFTVNNDTGNPYIIDPQIKMSTD